MNIKIISTKGEKILRLCADIESKCKLNKIEEANALLIDLLRTVTGNSIMDP